MCDQGAGAVGRPRAIEPLINALGDEDKSVRYAAAQGLGQLGDARAVEPLIKALRHGDLDVRRMAAGALGELGDRRAVEPLIKALEDEDGEVRWCVAEALKQLGDRRAIEPLIKALEDRFYKVRLAAAQALGQLGEGDRRAVEPLIKALVDEGHEDQYVRKAAAKSLEQLGDARAIEPLIMALGNTTSVPGRPGSVNEAAAVRQAAAEALDVLGGSNWKTVVRGDDGDWSRLIGSDDVRVIPLLIKFLTFRDRALRLSAAHKLLRVGLGNPDVLRAKWQQVAELSRTPHSDSHEDRSGNCTGHDDNHSDIGIGLDFPAEPPAGMAEEPVPPPTQPVDQGITVTCPNCGKTLNAPKASAGRTGRCPACNTRFLIAAQLDAGRSAKRDF